jgi:hypothetical protein
MIGRLVLTPLLMVLSPALAFAQFRTVTVQNAGSNPVPTTIQNTANVNIANTPSVNATISGTPAVNATITGTPSVTVSGTPNVSVTNLPTGTAGPGPTTGLLVKSLDNPAQQVFQKSIGCATVAAGGTNCLASFVVPAGKVLVLEYVQFFSTEFGGSSVTLCALDTTAAGTAQQYNFAPGPRVLTNHPLSEHLVRIYADPGSTVTFLGAEDTSVGNVNFNALLSGYLVNVP